MTHANTVLSVVQSGQAAARSRIAASWRRSFERHGLDPDDRRDADVATERELRQRREAAGALVTIASGGLDQLYRLVGASGCAVVLTDSDGMILDQRRADGDASAFDSWGLRNGADWSEGRQGTNGIGTCLVEARSVIIHRDQHYFARNVGMSCIDAPIYGALGQIIGALDVSSARADQTEAINVMISAMVGQTAKQIEAEAFRRAYPDARIVLAGGTEAELNALIAIDGDDVVVGATRAARQHFGWAPGAALDPRPATDVLGRRDGELSGFDRGEKAAVVRALTRAGGNVSAAARALGIGRATMYRRMKRLGLSEPQ